MIALGIKIKMEKPVDTTNIISIALTLISHYVVHVDSFICTSRCLSRGGNEADAHCCYG